MHDVFHASQLKPTIGYDGSYAKAANIPSFRPAADELGDYKVEDTLDHRSHGRGHSSCMEYLVKWRGYSVYESMWEPEANLTNCAHTFASYQKCRGLC